MAFSEVNLRRFMALQEILDVVDLQGIEAAVESFVTDFPDVQEDDSFVGDFEIYRSGNRINVFYNEGLLDQSLVLDLPLDSESQARVYSSFINHLLEVEAEC